MKIDLKTILPILFLFLTVSIKAQEGKSRFISAEGGYFINSPKYNPSGKYSIDSSLTVIKHAKDTIIGLTGLNWSLNYSQNFTKHLYWSAGIFSTSYGLQTKLPTIGLQRSKPDSTIYANVVKLHSIEIPVGVSYYQQIKRSFLFARLAVSPGLTYSQRFTVKALHYDNYDEISRTNIKFDCEKFYFGGQMEIGFAQHLSEHFQLLASYTATRQFSTFSVSDYFKVKFWCQFFHIGLNYKI